jgi:hypothetical protein|tara:strand:- start:239 stop:865 length:627 start_codon:yes stop_codon:yes gene_type:complete
MCKPSWQLFTSKWGFNAVRLPQYINKFYNSSKPKLRSYRNKIFVMRYLCLLVIILLNGVATAIEPPETPLTPAQIEQVIKLRQQLGLKLQGSFLNKVDDTSEAEFRQALQQLKSTLPSQTNGTGNTPKNLPNVTTATFETQRSPIFSGSDPLVHALRHTSLLLDQRSNQLEIMKNTEDARELRRLAKRLRKQVHRLETSPLQNHINKP